MRYPLLAMMLVVVLGWTCPALEGSTSPQRRPNIVVILADDLG